jgi:Fic family protein
VLKALKEEKEHRISGGIYHKLQVDMTYNSNHIEGNKLTHDETRYIYETKTIGVFNQTIKVDDIIETVNHFRCTDLAIDSAEYKLSESLIKQFHYILKSGTSDSSLSWFNVGDYKLIPNEVGGYETTPPEKVKEEIRNLLAEYNSKTNITVYDIIQFHQRFECIHPFQDGNGRVGRLIMFKECLKHNIVPILITDKMKEYYYRGLKQRDTQNRYLIETCLYGQDIVKKYLDYFRIVY